MLEIWVCMHLVSVDSLYAMKFDESSDPYYCILQVIEIVIAVASSRY